MGLKPDHWIKKMALEHNMIEPFVENFWVGDIVAHILEYRRGKPIKKKSQLFAVVFDHGS